MYEKFFGLSKRPFLAGPRTQAYFPAASIDGARQNLVRCIQRAEGPALIVGQAGAGKTLLCQLLAEQFRGQLGVAMLTGGRLSSRRALLQAILFELHLPYRNMEEGELRLSLMDHLSPRPECPNGILLIIDEAHTLPLRLLEETRLITNLTRDGEPRVRLVLAGGPGLEERFTHPKLESFNQRLAARCYLEPLTRDETLGYVRSQLSFAGGNPGAIIQDEAIQKIHAAADGIPRLINQLCDHALLLASMAGKQPVTAQLVQEAWSDLQQLPLPVNEETHARAQAAKQEDFIEFGSLDELPGTTTVEFGSTPAAAKRPTSHTPADDFHPEIEVTEDADDEQLDDTMLASESPVTLPFSSEYRRGMRLDPTRKLDEIERRLAMAASDDAFNPMSDLRDPDGPATIGGIGPEVELVFHGPHSPFGGSFLEEEVLFDRYAQLEANALANRPRVSSAEGQRISAMMQQHLDLAGAAQQPGKQAPAASHNVKHLAPIDPASDPVMPEPAMPKQAMADPLLRELAANLQDDSDLLIIEDDTPPSGPHVPPGRAGRKEYRRLFAQLRQQ